MPAEKRYVPGPSNYRAKTIKVDTMPRHGMVPPPPQDPSRTPRRKIIGVVEPVIVRGKGGEVRVVAKVDTGASRTTVGTDIAARAGLGPVLGTVRIRQSISKHPESRPLVAAVLVIAGVEFDVAAAIADRTEMKYHVIVGMDILGKGKFLVDPARVAGKKGKGGFE
jgi:hypothetical protein